MEIYTKHISINDIEYAIDTTQGIFSANSLDKATAILLKKIPSLDLTDDDIAIDAGCGWGPISLYLAQHVRNKNVKIYGTDINARARLLAHNNVMNAYPACSFETSTYEELQEKIGDHSARIILSNPPIRIGKEELHRFMLNHLSLLRDDGHAYMVIGKNLGADSLTTWLHTQGYECKKIASAKGFRILHITRA
ncbi:MAG: methyltransferase [Actinomycetaceae bacterium]|nr:methyltransferase [Actinomycetaceae bacterium]